MTCKDCIHYEACHDMYYEEHATRHFDPEKHNAEKECGYFKDRSLFVELPCKAGDTLYTIVTGNRIREWIVADISFFSYSVVKIVITADSKDNNGTDHMRFGKHYLNHSVFLSREAAEQALKERET